MKSVSHSCLILRINWDSCQNTRSHPFILVESIFRRKHFRLFFFLKGGYSELQYSIAKRIHEFFLQVLKSFNKMILKTYCKIISNLQKAISILQRLTPTCPLPRFSNLPHLFHFCACVRACIHTHTHTQPLVFFASVCEQATDMILQYP